MKIIEIDGIGSVHLIKTAKSRSIRLTVSDGRIRVSMPHWIPYASGIAFAESHRVWLERELAAHVTTLFEEGQKIGKLHHISFEKVSTGQQATSRVSATKIIVKYQTDEDLRAQTVQDRARKAVLRALKKEAEQLLPLRLKGLADRHGFHYRSFAAKQLRRRWGSCDSQKNLVFNVFLMQTPWECIDYVLLHELTHTEHMNHGELFWKRLTDVYPRARDIRRQLNTYRPMIGG